MSDRLTRSRLALVGLVLTLLVSSTPRILSAAEADEIPWQTDFEGAVALARHQGQPLWVQFTGPWCGFCRQMEATTFVSLPVIRLARERFISVSVRADLRGDLVDRFRVTGLPTALVLDPEGRVVARREGYVDPSGFAAMLRESAERFAAYSSPSPEDVALEGYCPVSLVRGGSLRRGQPRWATRYDGRVYRFVDREAREAFSEDPERYLPGLRGRCAVHLVDESASVPGDPNFGVYYKGRLYLCADESSRQRFAGDPERYVGADLGADGYCPHCRQAEGRLVRGRPQFPLTYEGQRYLFPDPAHREAFRAAPDRYLR